MYNKVCTIVTLRKARLRGPFGTRFLDAFPSLRVHDRIRLILTDENPNNRQRPFNLLFNCRNG
jgi:hypothetical protein